MSKSASYCEKPGVTRVTGVTAFVHAAYGVTPSTNVGVTRVTASHCGRLVVTPVTPVTPQKSVGVTRKPAWLLGVTLVTPVTPTKTGQEVENRERP